MNILDAAYTVLKAAKKPLTSKEVLSDMTSQELWKPDGDTPEASVGAALYSDIKKNGGKSRFMKVGHGYFALAGKEVSSKSNSGFVYILTHPCFRDNIVKIGRTQGAVEDRSDQLFTTALPLPFEIYATMKTSRFTQAEELIHLMFEKERINPKREFFNINPKKALEIFYKVQGLLSDGQITEDYKRQSVFDEDSKGESNGVGLKASERLLLDFWTAFNRYAEKRGDFMEKFALRKAGKYSFYDFGIKRKYHGMMRVTTRKGTIVCGFYFSGDRENYETFLSRHEDVEKVIGEPLDWRLAKKDAECIATKSFDINGPKSTWSEAFDWLCNMAIKFKRADEKFGATR